MGKSYSTNVSETNNLNLPISQQDVSNPLNLVNSAGSSVGNSNFSLTGSSFSTLDGGAISKAFDFGTQAISQVASLTSELNKRTADASSDALKAGLTSISGQDAAKATDWFQNPKIIAAAVALAVVYMFARK